MRKVLFTILLAALVAVPAAAAKPPTGPTTEPSATPTIVEPAHPISILDLPDVERTGGVEFGTKPGAPTHGGGGAVDPLSCGACLVTCWSVTGRNGPSDWSGHAYIYTHVNWCGNGAQLTYGTAWSTYDQSGWFRIGNTYGPWWSSGCVTCSSATATGYMLWTESIPVLGIDHNGTTWLNVHVNAYGGYSASG